MSNEQPAVQAGPDERLREWSERLQQLSREFPKSIAATIKPDAMRSILESLSRNLSSGASREAVFSCLLHNAVANPEHFNERYEALNKLNPAARLEFANAGTQPFHRQRAIKK